MLPVPRRASEVPFRLPTTTRWLGQQAIFPVSSLIHNLDLILPSTQFVASLESGLTKKKKMARSSDPGTQRQMSLDLLPSALVATVMTKLDIGSIRSLACTCKAFHSCASHMLRFIPSFHLLVSLFWSNIFVHDLSCSCCLNWFLFIRILLRLLNC